jgi:5S rRNA maturation endonuclease (ribonuclease M5)
VLLTDWDSKGDEMARNIEHHLRSMGSSPDAELRSRLKKLVKKEIKDVESLSHYMERMRELYGP